MVRCILFMPFRFDVNCDCFFFFFSSRRRHTRSDRDWSSDVCSSDLMSWYREMESTIAKTWHISFDQIRKQDQLAADYLSFMACIDRVNIPQSLLPLGDSLQQVKAVGTLKGYAFITEHLQAPQQLQGEKFF